MKRKKRMQKGFQFTVIAFEECLAASATGTVQLMSTDPATIDAATMNDFIKLHVSFYSYQVIDLII